MPVTIHFRGVSLFVTNGAAVTEVLFPNAETRKPPDHETLGDGSVGHADRSHAKPHYAGILTVGAAGSRHHLLLGRRVVFPSAGPTRLDASVRRLLPPLQRCTNSAGYTLQVLPPAEREGDRVATRIMLSGGELVAMEPDLSVEFEMDGHRGPPGPRQGYAYDVVWQSNADSVTLDVLTFGDQLDTRITLDAATPEAFLYCFDERKPDRDALTRVDQSQCNGPLTDHDFKWIYQLLDRKNTAQASWQDWLEGDQFPAPRTDCVPRGRDPHGLTEFPLIPVSTCYPTLFDGP